MFRSSYDVREARRPHSRPPLAGQLQYHHHCFNILIGAELSLLMITTFSLCSCFLSGEMIRQVVKEFLNNQNLAVRHHQLLED